MNQVSNNLLFDSVASIQVGLFSVHFHTTEFINNCYDHRSFTINAKNVLNDAPSSTWCRGLCLLRKPSLELYNLKVFNLLAPGTIEGLAMIENILESIARKLKKDPLEIRLANLDPASEMMKLLPDFIKSVGKI